MRPQTTPPPTHVLTRDGSRLHAWLHGPADAPLVALTHGLSLDHRAFDQQVPALVAAGYRVLTWDVRGHGRSQPMGERMSLEAVAGDLLALLEEVDTERAVLVGESFGGMAIQEALRRAPDRVVGLVVIGAPPLTSQPNVLLRGLQRLRIQMIKLWPDRLLRRVFTSMVSRHPEVRRYVGEATAQLPKRSFVAASAAAMQGHLETAPPLPPDVPLLLACGEREERPIARAMRAWADEQGGARLVVVPDAGHLVNQEQPEDLNTALLDFLAAHHPAS